MWSWVRLASLSNQPPVKEERGSLRAAWRGASGAASEGWLARRRTT
jgi:hypothetical protein